MHGVSAERIDLDRYFARVGFGGANAPTLETLHAIHLAHATTIPFENVDVLRGEAILLDLPSLQKKLIDARRGGYCFEQNLLLADVLEQLGFAITRLLARVTWGVTHDLPRTHMLLKVDIDGRAFIADCGFGGWGLLAPLALMSEEPQDQFGWRFRLRNEQHVWHLEGWLDRWDPLYAFTLEPQLPVDFEPANWFVSTHPQSRFVQTLTAQLPTPAQRYVLRNREFTTYTATDRQTRELADEAEVREIFARYFALPLPAGVGLRR
jgi:N-hydroxyarylamine O-acetyltransferase